MRFAETAQTAQWWQDYPGWIITTVLALAAAVASIAGVAWVIWRYYTDAPRVEWMVQSTSSGSGWSNVTLVNVGDAAAVNLHTVEPTGPKTAAYRLEPGHETTIRMEYGPTQADIEAAELKVHYLTAPVHRRQRRVLTYRPFNGKHSVEKH